MPEKLYDSDGREYTPFVPSEVSPASETGPNEPAATESTETASGPKQ